MKDYLKMADVFDCEVESDADLMFSDSLGNIADFSGYKTHCRYASHAINSHDELVAEVERLRSIAVELYHDGVNFIVAEDIDDIEDAAELHGRFNDTLIKAQMVLELK